MLASRVSSSRPNPRAALRHHTPWQSSRPLGRRGYETLQERVATGSDRPWQLAALAVTVPGVLYLRSADIRRGPSPGASVGEAKVVEQVAKPSGEPKVESTPQAKFEAAVEKTRNPDSGSATSGGSEAATSPSSANAESEMGESPNGQAEKPTDMQASQQEETAGK